MMSCIYTHACTLAAGSLSINDVMVTEGDDLTISAVLTLGTGTTAIDEFSVDLEFTPMTASE